MRNLQNAITEGTSPIVCHVLRVQQEIITASEISVSGMDDRGKRATKSGKGKGRTETGQDRTNTTVIPHGTSRDPGLDWTGLFSISTDLKLPHFQPSTTDGLLTDRL